MNGINRIHSNNIYTTHMKIITLEQIKEILPSLDLLPAIEEGFAAYSAGKVVVPPVGELLLDKGDVHIKYGYLKEDEYYVIKIASGFYENPTLGLSSTNGMMLLFKQETGEPIGILLDEGASDRYPNRHCRRHCR